MSLALAGGFFTTNAKWEAPLISYSLISVQTEEIQPTTTLRNPTSFSLMYQQHESQTNKPSCCKHLLGRLAGNHGLPAPSYFIGGPSGSPRVSLTSDIARPQGLSLGLSYSLPGDLIPPQSTKMVPLQPTPIFSRQPGPVFQAPGCVSNSTSPPEHLVDTSDWYPEPPGLLSLTYRLSALTDIPVFLTVHNTDLQCILASRAKLLATTTGQIAQWLVGQCRYEEWILLGEKCHISALVKSRDANSSLFVGQMILENGYWVSWSKAQICFLSSEITFPTEKKAGLPQWLRG